jgi:uncharacterized membrane protein
MEHMDRYIQPVSSFENWAAIILIVISNSFGNLFLALGMKEIPGFGSVSLSRYILEVFTSPWIVAGIGLLALWMFSQLTMLTWADLTYLIPVTGIGYGLTALLGFIVLDENISIRRGTGIVLISLGVVLVAQTGPRTERIQGSGE